ncbi:hypothetical protein [Nocardia otitidiscaviarum]|uniref:hypothetical protein n=1 Tax=Nocardia otitidiscaviarum TaxID=1823 RepID=UPI001894D7EC|nr:hypothetical protein [Nocardia otitidiscaviarum]MBF6183522.1 hypothetical protein [Nocardia otitidiscaviarum]
MNPPFDLRRVVLSAVVLIAASIVAACGGEDPVDIELQKPAICTEPAPNFRKLEYDVLKEMQIPSEMKQQFPEMFDGNGELKPWETLSSGQASEVQQRMTAVSILLDAADGEAVRTRSDLRDDYWREFHSKCD